MQNIFGSFNYFALLCGIKTTKNNKTMTNLTPLTPNQEKRVISSIVETQRLIDREMQISADLRYNDKIEGWEKHIEHLNNMILNGWNAPKF